MSNKLDEKGMCHRITLDEVDFTQNAHITIGLAVQHIAQGVGMDVRKIYSRLLGDMWWREEDGALMLVLEFEDSEAVQSMFVEIPADHWGVKGQSEAVNQ